MDCFAALLASAGAQFYQAQIMGPTMIDTEAAPDATSVTGSRRDDSRWAAAVKRRLETVDVRLDGGRPWDIQVNDARLFRRLVTGGFVGFGDAYVDGWWDCDALDQLYDRCIRGGLSDQAPVTVHGLLEYGRQRLFNQQRIGKARGNVEAHYHLGADLFCAMLDERMIYSCAYWKDAVTLAAAQEAKLELICKKVGLKPGQRVLDIGSGWGGFAKYAAERHGVSVVGVNVSSEQVSFATEACKGLPVEFRLQDYREIRGSFDHVISIGFMEHVGPKNLRALMEVVDRCLKEDGLCLMHFFAGKRSFPTLRDSEVLWITKYIFPGLVVPSLKQIGSAVDGLFVTEDLHNIGSHYDPTLMAWFGNFERNWPSLEKAYGPRFYRMWKHYLLACAGAFRSRKYQLWQLVLSRHGVRGGYAPIG
jgi:cyclopropane-fatty-acyl-phospholipid synthase